MLPHTAQLDETLTWLYLAEVLADAVACSKRTLLTSVNVRVDEINSLIADMLPGLTAERSA